MERIDVLFDVLAEPNRRRVVELLAAEPKRAGELSAHLGMSPPAMSRHLKVLLDAGIVVDERVPDDARYRVFRLRPESLAGVQAWLDQLHAEWTVNLRAFKRHVEGKQRR